MKQTSTALNADWAAEWTLRIGAHVAKLRATQKMSAQDVASRTRKLGFEVTRSSIANLESGRKTAVSLVELAVLAAALEVAPVRLLFDVEGEDVEVLPGLTASQVKGADWFAGLATLQERNPAVRSETELLGPLYYFRKHQDALNTFLVFVARTDNKPQGSRRTEAEEETLKAQAERVSAVRETICALKYRLPGLDPEVHAALARWTNDV